MLQSTTLAFLTELAQNNNKPWFEANKEKYEAAKQDFEVYIAEILDGLGQIEPLFKEQNAKNCIFRIYRDVRFSKDKTPYKAHFGAHLNKGGKKFTGAGFYLHLEPGKCFAGGGLWMPEAPLLKAVRQEINYNFEAFKLVLEDVQFKKQFGVIEGEQLKTVPKGYEATNPAAEYLRMKSFIAGHCLTDEEITSRASIKQCVEIFATMTPFINFLNKSFD